MQEWTHLRAHENYETEEKAQEVIESWRAGDNGWDLRKNHNIFRVVEEKKDECRG